jgi:hypothetical protein
MIGHHNVKVMVGALNHTDRKTIAIWYIPS